MCGLFGWNFKRKSRVEIGKRECVASVLAIANSLRGDKSWGVYTNSKQGASVRKQVGDISMVPDFSTYGRYPLVMGHTRWPTQGKVTQKNAHPFTVNKITLAHNGVISNSDALDKKYNRAVRVDSQHFAHHLDEEKSFEDIEGYGTITWVHADAPERVFICRMRNGSLSVWGIKNPLGEHVGVIWSSDADHIRNAIGAARLSGAFPFTQFSEGHIHYVEDGKLYECPADTRKLILKSPPVYASSYYGNSENYFLKEEKGWWIRKESGKWEWIQKKGGFTTFRANDSDALNHISRHPHTIKRVGNGVQIEEELGDQHSMRFTRFDPDMDEETQLRQFGAIRYHSHEGD